MIKFHHDPVNGYTYGLATESHGDGVYGHGGNTYGAQSQADYFESLGASIAVAANNELWAPHWAAPQVGYVMCLAFIATSNALHDENLPLRETCESIGKGPMAGFENYRDQNLQKASK